LSFHHLVCLINNSLILRVIRDPCYKANVKAQTKLKKGFRGGGGALSILIYHGILITEKVCKG
jgi:hypothetical protein